MAKTSVSDFQIFAKPAGSQCNLACHYCYYLGRGPSSSPRKSRMSERILETYIRQHIVAASGPIVNFSWHGGEPTLSGIDYFQRIVALQKKYCPAKKQCTNGIQTNGTRLNSDWCKFFINNRFSVGISIDGPAEIHNAYRRDTKGSATHETVMQGWSYLQDYNVPTDVLCVINDVSVMYPMQVYRFLRDIGAKYISFLPLVEKTPDSAHLVTERSVQPELFGAFLCAVFDEWKTHDIGRIKIQIFEEALRTAFNQDHSLCIFRPTCGNIPVLETDGSLYACDHYVAQEFLIGNIMQEPIKRLLVTPKLRSFGRQKQSTLSRKCQTCEVLRMCHGECPRNRFVACEGEQFPQNYLCDGYKLFFNHCRPFVDAVAHEWRQSKQSSRNTNTGRNDPCPCGSGKKYKKCCLPG